MHSHRWRSCDLPNPSGPSGSFALRIKRGHSWFPALREAGHRARLRLLPMKTRTKGRSRQASAVTLAGDGDPDWYKDAIIYELRVGAFHDSDGDGVGDFRGLTQRLDYLHELGVTALWLLPFYPSPLRDDGYDISRSEERRVGKECTAE